MADRFLKTQHAVTGGGEAAMVLKGDDHTEVGPDLGTPFEGLFGVSSDGWFLCRRGTF